MPRLREVVPINVVFCKRVFIFLFSKLFSEQKILHNGMYGLPVCHEKMCESGIFKYLRCAM